MADETKRLVTDRRAHHIYLVEDEIRRWVPDLWTLNDTGLSPADLEILSDQEVDAIELGEELPSTVPSPKLAVGTYVETQSGVYRVTEQGLARVAHPQRLSIDQADFDAEKVIYLPASIVRSIGRIGVER